MHEEEDDFDPMERHKRLRQMPLFIKAVEISELVRHLVKSVENTEIKFKREDEKQTLDHNLDYLVKKSLIIPAKIAGAAGVDA